MVNYKDYSSYTFLVQLKCMHHLIRNHIFSACTSDIGRIRYLSTYGFRGAS